jgi:hypothetical protein
MRRAPGEEPDAIGQQVDLSAANSRLAALLRLENPEPRARVGAIGRNPAHTSSGGPLDWWCTCAVLPRPLGSEGPVDLRLVWRRGFGFTSQQRDGARWLPTQGSILRPFAHVTKWPSLWPHSHI